MVQVQQGEPKEKLAHGAGFSFGFFVRFHPTFPYTLQPAARRAADVQTLPTALCAARAVCPRGKFAQLAEHREDNWVITGSRWFKSNRGSQKQGHGHRPCPCFCFLLLNLTNDFVDSESAARRAADVQTLPSARGAGTLPARQTASPSARSDGGQVITGSRWFKLGRGSQKVQVFRLGLFHLFRRHNII